MECISEGQEHVGYVVRGNDGVGASDKSETDRRRI